jgi:hypothetical protein
MTPVASNFPAPASLAAGLGSHAPSEVAFSGTVTSQPHFFFGKNTQAMHEAFEVRSDDGHDVEIVDNVKLAPRVPVAVGDRIGVQGELIPDASHGPLVHWTHHDPSGHHEDGFLDFDGRRYA